MCDQSQNCVCGLNTGDLIYAVCGHWVCTDCLILCENCGEEYVCSVCVVKDGEGRDLCCEDCMVEEEEEDDMKLSRLRELIQEHDELKQFLEAGQYNNMQLSMENSALDFRLTHKQTLAIWPVIENHLKLQIQELKKEIE